MPRFETHSHSYYSNLRILDSINRPKDMILTAAKLGYRGITLTDHEALCGAVEWLKNEKELKEKEKIPQDFKCAIGNEIYLTETRVVKQKYYHYILIAKDTIGFHQLCELSSKSWYHSYFDRGLERVPTLKSELIEVVKKNPGHIIAATACLAGETATLTLELLEAEQSQNQEEIINVRHKIEKWVEFNKDLFGEDFYFEIAPSKSADQIKFNKKLKQLARIFKVKIICGSDAHYLLGPDRYVHKAYLNSKEGEREVDDFYTYAHLMDDAEAFENLSASNYSMDEFLEICENSLEIMNKIESYDIFHTPIIPEVEVKSYSKNIPDYIKGQDRWRLLQNLFVSDNIQERFWINECYIALSKKTLLSDKYLDRLQVEADILKTVGDKLNNCLFSYFNTFQHFINTFWDCGSIVGPGRGSAVCYLSNYLLGITQLDPVQWGLAEWRFLNKERLELPDIDIDLCPSKRAKIFERIREERGETNLLQVATFGTEGGRSAVLTACRGYRSEEYPNGIDVDTAQYIASLIPQERGFLWSIHDMVYGNEEKDRKPNQAFIDECDKYPGLLKIISQIEGIVNKRSQHASGVIIYNQDPWNTGAIMKSPNGDLTTQFSLHDAEAMGDTKFDFLLTEISDKLVNAVLLLQKDGRLPQDLTLRQVYDKYLHPAVLDVNDSKIWDALSAGTVTDVFQFNTDVGLQGAMSVKPRSPIEMMMTNALIRLTAEKGKERPMDRYIRMKNNINEWYNECRLRGLNEEEIKVLEPYYLPVAGTPTTQEKLMMLCMEPKLAHFSLGDANKARKICAKKKLSEIPALHDKFVSQCPNANLGEYVWETAIEPQMSYAFAEPHALAYSFVGIQTLYLATHFPVIYWNCACLITNSGADDLFEKSLKEEVQDEYDEEIVDIYEPEDMDDYVYEDAPDRSCKKKKKVKTVNFGKIATAIGQFQAAGISLTPPDINHSSYTFIPDCEHNDIICGLYGLTRISADLVSQIIKNRPYTSTEDFMDKVKVNKPQMLTLIKSGAFDSLYPDREKLLKDYLTSIADTKNKLTLANIPMLIKYDVFPEGCEGYIELYQFNKFLRKHLNKETGLIEIPEKALAHYCDNYDMDLLINQNMIRDKDWDKQYKKYIKPLSDFIKENNDFLLEDLNKKIVQEKYDVSVNGNISHCEMEAMSFYYHEHELAHVDKQLYSLVNFDNLPEDPEIDKTFKGEGGKEIPLYKLHWIVGTVLDKNKIKNSISLLTPDGVVTVKIWKNQYAKYDKQISMVGDDGKKKVMERSWFKRGTLLFIQGIRRGNSFVPKAYKGSPYKIPIMKILEVNDNGTMVFTNKRFDE